MVTPAQKPQNLGSNFWKVYFYRFLSDFWLIAPVMVPFYVENGLDATQVFTVQAVYAVGLLVFEVPSGYLADVIGRRNTLIIGSIALPIGFAVYAFSTGFYGFVAAEIVLSIAGAMRSGTDSALIYDTLIQTGSESDYKKFEGTAEFFHQLAHASSAILGGLFALTSLRFPFYINIASGLILFPLAVSFVEPERKTLEAESPFLEILRIARHCLTHSRIKWLMMFSALLLGASMTGAWSYYLYYGELGLSVWLYGVIFAAFGVCAAVGSSQAQYIEGKLGPRRSLLLLLLISPIFIMLGLIKSTYMIPLILLVGFLGGLSIPLFRDHINKLVESDIRATALSVSAMIGSLAFVVLAPLFGEVVDAFSLSVAHVALGVFFLASALYCLFQLYKHRVI